MTINFLILVAASVGGIVLVVLALAFLAWMVVRRVQSDRGGANLSADKAEAAVSLVAALFVLFSAMLNPVLSAGLAIIFLLSLAVYKLLPQRRIG